MPSQVRSNTAIYKGIYRNLLQINSFINLSLSEKLVIHHFSCQSRKGITEIGFPGSDGASTDVVAKGSTCILRRQGGQHHALLSRPPIHGCRHRLLSRQLQRLHHTHNLTQDLNYMADSLEVPSCGGWIEHGKLQAMIRANDENCATCQRNSCKPSREARGKPVESSSSGSSISKSVASFRFSSAIISKGNSEPRS